MQEQKKNRDRWIHIRVTEAEHSQIHKQFKTTTERQFSAYARKVLFGKPMIKGYKNESLKEITSTLFELRKDLNGIANNLNQVVHKLHTTGGDAELKGWLMSFEFSRKSTSKSIEDIKVFINKTAEKWLQS